MKLVEHVRVAPGIEVVGLTRGETRRRPFPTALGGSTAQMVKTTNDARLERPQLFQRAFGLQGDKAAPVASRDDGHAEFAGVERREPVRELSNSIEQIGDLEVKAQWKRRLQGRVKAVAARVAGHAPPRVRRVALEREPVDGRAGPRVAADHVATETPQVAVGRRRKIEGVSVRG